MQMLIVIKGRVPSKKNSKQIKYSYGRPKIVSSDEYYAWHQEQSYRLKKIPKPIESCAVILEFYCPDMIKADLSNKTESVMDLLVDNGILKDDNWFVVGDVHLIFKGLDRLNPRVEITINEIN